MDSCRKNPAVRRFVRRCLTGAAAYVLCVLVACMGYLHLPPTLPLAVLLAILPGVPIAALVAVCALYLKEEKDDFVRSVMVQTMLWSFGGTLVITSVWGFLEKFTHTPHLDPIMIYPMTCGLYVLVSPLVMRRYR